MFSVEEDCSVAVADMAKGFENEHQRIAIWGAGQVRET